MIPLIVAAALSTAGSLAAQKQGIDAGKKFDADAAKALRENQETWDALQTPDFQNITPEQESWLQDYIAKTYDPSLANGGLLKDTAYSGISTDPRLKEQQMAALSSLAEIGKNGMTAQDAANMAKMQSEVGQADRGRREAVLQNMRSRGMSGSGMELLSQMQGAQAATDRAAQEGLNIQGMTQARALDALQRGGALAGDMRGQDFGEQARIAEARDAINRFNASTINNAGMANTAATNDANKFNVSGRQQVLGNNVNTANKAQQTNKIEIPKAQFDANTQKVMGQSGAKIGSANSAIHSGDRSAKMWGEVGQGLMGMGGQFGAAAAKSDKNAKSDIKNVSSKDVDEFLKALKSKSYKYKDSSEHKPKIGFIMQDIENTKIGKKISRTTEDGMKGYDPQSLQGVTLAALKHLSEKIDKKG